MLHARWAEQGGRGEFASDHEWDRVVVARALPECSEHQGAFRSLWELLEPLASLREPLGASGSLRVRREPRGAFWEPLEGFWKPLEAFGSLWGALGASGTQKPT